MARDVDMAVLCCKCNKVYFLDTGSNARVVDLRSRRNYKCASKETTGICTYLLELVMTVVAPQLQPLEWTAVA